MKNSFNEVNFSVKIELLPAQEIHCFVPVSYFQIQQLLLQTIVFAEP